MTPDRDLLLQAIHTVVGGTALRRYSPDTITGAGRCAQLVRETVEGALGLKPSAWDVGVLAHDFRKARSGTDRWASDYERAARKLGLNKPADTLVPGDVLYWPYRAANGNDYGHTALYAGVIGGRPCVLENSDWAPATRHQQGAQLPLGDRAHVYVSPLTLLGTPSTVATPTLEILAAETVTAPPPPAPAAAAADVRYLWVPVIGVDGVPEPGNPVSIPVDSQGRLLVQANGQPRVVRVPDDRLRGGK